MITAILVIKIMIAINKKQKKAIFNMCSSKNKNSTNYKNIGNNNHDNNSNSNNSDL